MNESSNFSEIHEVSMGVPCLSTWSRTDLIVSDSHLREDLLCTSDSPLDILLFINRPPLSSRGGGGGGGRNPAKFLDLLFSQ